MSAPPNYGSIVRIRSALEGFLGLWGYPYDNDKRCKRCPAKSKARRDNKGQKKNDGDERLGWCSGNKENGFQQPAHCSWCVLGSAGPKCWAHDQIRDEITAAINEVHGGTGVLLPRGLPGGGDEDR